MLILASLVFVAFDSLWSVPLMLAVVIANWVLGLCVCRWGRIFLWGGAALDVLHTALMLQSKFAGL